MSIGRASAPRPIPLTVVGGFLGAGKTTLVNAVLARAHGRRIAVLVNDFGALSIDAALVSARSARTVTLANGCVCCTLVSGLAQALIDVLQLDPAPDHVLIEASGVGDPRRIAQIARADRAFTQDATLVLADANAIHALAADRYVGDTVLRQLAGADLVVLNKIDLVDDDGAHATAAWLHEIAPQARIVRTRDADLPCEVVLGTRTPTTDDELSASSNGGSAPSYRATDHGDVFATRTFRCTHPIDEAAMRGALDALPDAVLRAKGFVRFESDPSAVALLQVVGRRWSLAPAPPDAPVAQSVLVVIGASEPLARADLAPIEALFDRNARGFVAAPQALR